MLCSAWRKKGWWSNRGFPGRGKAWDRCTVWCGGFGKEEEKAVNLDPFELSPVTLRQAKDILVRAAVEDPGVSILLWGHPGIGKSSIVYQATQQANRQLPESERYRGVADVRLNSYGPMDFRIPKVEEDMARWVPSDFFARHAKERWVLFLDELTTAPEASMHAGLEIVLEHKVADLRFHPGTLVVGAANPVTSLSSTSRLTAALANRFQLHLFLRPDVASFAAYAQEKGLFPLIPAFLRLHEDLLLKLPKAQGDIAAWPSPRSWEGLSRVLSLLRIAPGEEVPLPVAAGAVGQEAGVMFARFARVEGLRKILAEIEEKGGKATSLAGAEASLQYTVESMLAMRGRQLLSGEEKEQLRLLDRIAEYVVERMTLPLQTLFFRDLFAGSAWESLGTLVRYSPALQQWLTEHREALLEEETA